MVMDEVSNALIDYNQVLYADRYELARRVSSKRKGRLLYAARSLFLSQFKFPARRKKVDFLFFRCLVRDDYKLLFRSIANVVPENNKVVIDDYIENSLRFAPDAILVFITKLHLFFSFKATGLRERIYLYMRLCYYFRILRKVRKYKFRHLVVFADMQPVENLLCQYFKRTKTTTTLQHGLYVDYTDQPNINIINYEHQCASNFLSWGDGTAQLIKRYHSDCNVVICGRPTVFAVKNESGQHPNRYVTAVMDQNLFEQINFQILRLLDVFCRKFGLTLNVRFHPYNHRPRYRSLGIQFSEDVDVMSSLFVVGHTSSLLHELLALDIPTFKFSTSVPSLYFPKEIMFCTAEELEEKVSVPHEFKAIGERYIAYSGEKSLQAYSAFFQSLARG